MTIDEIIQLILSNPFFVKYGLLGLFANGVLSSTVLPQPPEITVAALIAAGYDKLAIFAVLTAASIIGAFIGYYIGRGGSKAFAFLMGRPKKEDDEKTGNILRKYGWIAIFGSPWIPVVGDFIPVVAGARKYDLRKFALAISAGKMLRAFAVVYLAGVVIPKLLG